MKISDLTLGGILTAITIIILYITSFIPTNTLTLLTLASITVPIAIMRSNLKTASIVYISSTLIAILVIPPNITLAYGLFFGFYGIIKYLLERIDSLPLEYLLKLLFFNIVLFIGFYITQTLLGFHILNNLQEILTRFTSISLKYSSFILFWFLAQIVFAIYDYGLTLLISMYKNYFPTR